MGKKSKRNNKNNGGPVRKGRIAAVPTAPATPPANFFVTVTRFMDAHNFYQVLKLESKYRHLDSFSFDPFEDLEILHAFGAANNASPHDEACFNRAIHYYEKAKERIEDAYANAIDQYQHRIIMIKRITMIKITIGMNLPQLYAGRDMEKTISSYRWLLANCSRSEVTAQYVIQLSNHFNRCEKFEYAMEVLEGSLHMVKTFEEEYQAEILLITAYIGCGEFLKAKAAYEKRRSSNRRVLNFVLQSGRIEEGLRNYETAIDRYREDVNAVKDALQKHGNVLPKEENVNLSGTRVAYSLGFATSLLRHSTDNAVEAFAIFQVELDRCVESSDDRELILFRTGIEYRNLNKWDQSIETLQQLCLSVSRPDRPESTMLYQANEAIAQTYLERYCTDTTLDIDQRTQNLSHAADHSMIVRHVVAEDKVSTEMHLIDAQLFYFNDDKQQAFHHLELYLDARVAECKHSCYTCEQRVRHGSVPFSCASCQVASYCDRKHQKMTWKKERICHKVLCPLLGYWRVARKKHKKRKGLTNEDRCEYEGLVEAFFESICPHVKTSTSSYVDGLIFVD